MGLLGCEAVKQPRGAYGRIALNRAIPDAMRFRLRHGADSLLRNSVGPVPPAPRPLTCPTQAVDTDRYDSARIHRDGQVYGRVRAGADHRATHSCARPARNQSIQGGEAGQQ